MEVIQTCLSLRSEMNARLCMGWGLGVGVGGWGLGVGVCEVVTTEPLHSRARA